MRKNFLAIGSFVVATFLTVSLLSNPFSSRAADASVDANATALTGTGSGGKCTGPKESGECKSSNAYACSDNVGCNSSVEQVK
ncbi:MAG: hypothetical protein KA821_00715 [Chitinophagaceae bacterium]|nr:hypothetical protein [Chitinophagaceae bacterium]